MAGPKRISPIQPLYIRTETAMRQIMRMVVLMHWILSPANMRVILPAFSIRTSETKVMATLTVPIPRVAYCAANSSNPADLKIEVEKNMACGTK